MAIANKFLRDYRKSRGCRELTQAELDGDWSQSLPCGCGNCDLGPRHPTSLQLLARDACGSQHIPKAFQLSSVVEEFSSSPLCEYQSIQSRNNQSKQAKNKRQKRKYKTFKRKPDSSLIQPFDDSLESLELTASEIEWLDEQTPLVPAFNVIEVLTASRTTERLSLLTVQAMVSSKEPKWTSVPVARDHEIEMTCGLDTGATHSIMSYKKGFKKRAF